MTEYIIGERQSGKTTELIRRSAETGAYILVANKSTASLIFKQAKMNDYNIPYPITIDDVLSCTINKSVWSKGILIDELESLVNGGSVTACLSPYKDYSNLQAVTIVRKTELTVKKYIDDSKEA